jgi:tRNA G18 (ribose-2'-O)-methylase SpoU
VLVHITDPADPRLADYRNVPDPELVERSGIFIAEGRLVVRRLLTASRFAARSLMVTETARAALADTIDNAGALPVYVVPQALMNGVTGFNIHRGCLAIGERQPSADWRTVVSGAARLVALERVANADNVGSVFRNAAAFGAGAVVLDESTTDPLYRKAIRTSMGAALTVPFARACPWPEALDELRRAGIVLVGLTPDPRATPLRDVAATLAEKPVALVFGHEGDGLSPAALAACHHQARIPMASSVDSLNVGTASAIALYEFARSAS